MHACAPCAHSAWAGQAKRGPDFLEWELWVVRGSCRAEKQVDSRVSLVTPPHLPRWRGLHWPCTDQSCLLCIVRKPVPRLQQVPQGCAVWMAGKRPSMDNLQESEKICYGSVCQLDSTCNHLRRESQWDTVWVRVACEGFFSLLWVWEGPILWGQNHSISLDWINAERELSTSVYTFLSLCIWLWMLCDWLVQIPAALTSLQYRS